MWIVYSLIVVFIGVISVVVIRTLGFKPEPLKAEKAEVIKIDEARVIESLQAMIRFKTVSFKDKTKEDPSTFKGFQDYLKTRYPLIHEKAKFYSIEETGLLFELKVKKPSKTVVLMSHYDVVPENGTWSEDPFSGNIIEGKIYGRGTLDTKTTLCAVMESVEHSLKTNAKLDYDLYLAFSGDEETRGPSADNIVQFLKTKGVAPDFVLDEGGAVVENVFPGVKKKAAMVGLAEKGYINMRVEAKAQGGHASMPSKITPITELAKAVENLNKGTLFKLKKTPATMQMFDTIARHSTSFVNRMVFANVWLFWPLVKLMAKKSDGELLSLLHTTQAFTQMQGSDAMNVLPSQASLGINYRILTNESIESVTKQVIKRIDNKNLNIEVVQGANPTSISETSKSYEVLKETILSMWEDVVPTPYLMMAGTDSRYYHDISTHVYRFSPMTMTASERATIHSTEEAIRIEELLHCVKFYIHLLKNLNE